MARISKPKQLPSGRWRIRWRDARGERKSDTFDSHDQAVTALRRRLVEVGDVRSGRSRPRSQETLREAAKEWLATRSPKRRAYNKRHLDLHILPTLGAKRLSDITPLEVQRFIRRLERTETARPGETNDEGRTLKPATINNILITLRKMLNDLDYPIRIRYRVPESDYGWLKSETDVARFLAECDGWFRMAAELAVYAGFRKGEVAGLTWGRVDFDRSLIRIDRSYDEPAKSKRVRSVALSPVLAKSLQRWRVRHGGPFVVTMDGRRITLATELAKRTRRTCKRAGVDPVTFHQLRHTYASHMAARVSLPIVGAMLGHADLKTTARYAHIDAASLVQDPRLHLDFTAQDADVIELREREPGEPQPLPQKLRG